MYRMIANYMNNSNMEWNTFVMTQNFSSAKSSTTEVCFGWCGPCIMRSFPGPENRIMQGPGVLWNYWSSIIGCETYVWPPYF